MRPCIALLFLSAVVGCGSPSTADEAARPHAYPWDGASWSTDIVIDGQAEDQDAVRSFIYYLKENVGEGSLGPFGDTNEKYKGRVFWDADVWVFPALALVDPERASVISDFRMRTAYHAQLDTRSSLGGKYRPSVDDRLTTGLARVVDSEMPLKFPWEADDRGRDASETVTRKEEHVSGAVVWGLRLAKDLELATSPHVDKVGMAVANYYVVRSSVHLRDARVIKDVVSVDEWFEGDNCLYTNAIADWTIKTYLGLDLRMQYPHNAKGELVAYEGDQERAYQQAAAPLILWPLEREDLVDDPIAFLERFEGKEAPGGPAMSLSVYALIRARYGDADSARKTWRESWKKYTDGNPMLKFSERPGRKDLTYFNTGAAGCLNAVIYGFIGARIVDDASKDDAKIELKNGRWLVFRPNLPSAWKKVTFKGMQVLGKSYTVVCEGRRAEVVGPMMSDE